MCSKGASEYFSDLISQHPTELVYYACIKPYRPFAGEFARGYRHVMSSDEIPGTLNAPLLCYASGQGRAAVQLLCTLQLLWTKVPIRYLQTPKLATQISVCTHLG